MGLNQRRSVVMSDDEVRAHLERNRTATMATLGRSGVPHLVAMWYGIFDGHVVFETKSKSQKAVNLRRNPTIAVLVESGDTYAQLQGVAIEGVAMIIDDDTDDEYWRAAISVYERNTGPYSPRSLGAVQAMMNKRIVVRVVPQRIRSWDHRKLGMAGSVESGEPPR